MIHFSVEQDGSNDLVKLKTVNETPKIFYCCKFCKCCKFLASLEILLPAFSFSTSWWNSTLYSHIPRINTIPYILHENYQILAWHNTCNHFLTNKKHWILLKLWIEYTPHKLLEQGEPEYYSWYQHYRPEKNLQTYPGTVKAQITSTKHYAKYLIIFSIRKKQANHIIK